MFFGWYVVGGTFIAQLFVVGFFMYSVSLVVPFVREDFGVSLEQVMYSLTLGTFFGLVLMPIAGILLDKFSIRWIMTAGTLVFAAGLWLLSRCTTITQFIIIFGFTYSISNALASSVASQTAISRWFTVSRGRALGISAIGTSIGGMLIPALVAYWLNSGGWRVALENLTYAILLVALPVVVLSVRGKPADMGMQPEPDPSPVASAPLDANLGLGDILRKPGFWYIGVALGLLFAVYSSMLANLTPYVIDLGSSTERASQLIMVLAVTGLLGKLLFGYAADIIPLKTGLRLSMLFVAIAFLIMASEPGLVWLVLAAALLGLATGGMLPTWGALMARVFGLVSYGRAMGLMGPLITLSIMPSFAIVGRLYDQTGSYQSSLLLFAGLMLVSMCILIPLKVDAGQSPDAAKTGEA
ncbi:MAG: MFS transporter [Gammaproteobacteria bacterium]|nr:MFS transporter [Gammaproteobacteria bacterium]NND39355.1 MFS transporter [Pseudomonadales bacterium]NNM10502.1 MFS transporter [Pseudomonadales bacterium]